MRRIGASVVVAPLEDDLIPVDLQGDIHDNRSSPRGDDGGVLANHPHLLANLGVSTFILPISSEGPARSASIVLVRAVVTHLPLHASAAAKLTASHVTPPNQVKPRHKTLGFLVSA